MPNGGHICCEYCLYSNERTRRCDIFGVETSVFLLCRMFRVSEQQSHQQAREQWPMLSDLEPGKIYAIDNSALGEGEPRPVYKIVAVVPRNRPPW